MKSDDGINNSIKAMRSRLGLSQGRLAAITGVARQTVSGIEAGLYAPSAAVALRLARALGCTVEQLFWLEDDLPTIQLEDSASLPAGARVSLARVGERWIARELEADRAFRLEMMPADGVCLGSGEFRLLDDPKLLERTVVLAGCTPAMSLWARSAERWHPGLRVQWLHSNSMSALQYLADRQVHAAGIHLYDPTTDDFNVPFVRKLLPGRKVDLVNLGIWEEGLAVQPGNPLRIEQAADLARRGVRLVNRESGAGCRMVLDLYLQQNGVSVGDVSGYQEQVLSHQDVARRVADGGADVGVTTASIAEIYGLSFVPLRNVRYDLAMLREFAEYPPMKELLSTLGNRWVRRQLAALGGYDTSRTGELLTID